MIRFRNPGTQYSTQIQVIKQLYQALKDQQSFSLDDMAVVIAKGKLMTAYGYAGEQAIELSNTEQESLNSAKMNAKMYAEVFRMLGWVCPFSSKASYPLSFTYLGVHVAMSEGDCTSLYEQCVLGINNPTLLTDNLHYSEKVRFFKCALRTLIDLGGIMYKHELCLGPMSVDDLDESSYQAMLERIRAIRGSEKRLKEAFGNLAQSLGMKETPVDNCTRLPIAFMKSCGWIESVDNTTLYNKSKKCIKITEHGIDTYNKIKEMKDIRLDEFQTQPTIVQESLIRLGMYSMLKRANYDLTPVLKKIEEDEQICFGILGNKEILFSPCQTLQKNMVESALNLQIGGESEGQYNLNSFKSNVKERESLGFIRELKIDSKGILKAELLCEPEDKIFLARVSELKSKSFACDKIVDILFNEYASATQTIFYPLISTLFKVMGFNCSYSRPGDNGARWDAIIDDPNRSVPIEIKSPTEEQHISIKAIRQAIENKIVLLSRRTHITDKETSSLAVGYYLPNERAEVSRLINDFKETYGYKIGVIDLKSLLMIAVSILVDGKGFNQEEIYNMEGLSNASI